MSVTLPILAAVMAASVVGGNFVTTNPAPVDTTYLSAAVGMFDVFDNAERNVATDMRLEYSPSSWALYKHGILTVRPFFGAEFTTDGAVYGLGGLAFDMQYYNWYVTPSFGGGAWHNGGGKDMGSAIEFRSQVETGYQFDNHARVGVSLSHISNGNIGDENPGAEQISVYYHHPVNF